MLSIGEWVIQESPSCILITRCLSKVWWGWVCLVGEVLVCLFVCDATSSRWNVDFNATTCNREPANMQQQKNRIVFPKHGKYMKQYADQTCERGSIDNINFRTLNFQISNIKTVFGNLEKGQRSIFVCLEKSFVTPARTFFNRGGENICKMLHSNF